LSGKSLLLSLNENKTTFVIEVDISDNFDIPTLSDDDMNQTI